MIVVSVLYPNEAGATFNLDYYRESHLPLVRKLLAPQGMTSLSYYQPQVGDDATPYKLVAELRFNTMAETEKALGAHGPETQADIPNFTTITPLVLIGEEIQA